MSESKMSIKNILIGSKSYWVASDDQYIESVGNDFEPHMVQLFKTLIKPDDVVADIGANIGLTTLLFSDLAKYVYAFEACSSTYDILQKNLKSNNIQNVQGINFGIGQKSETLTITFATNNRSGGFVSNKIQPMKGHTTEDINIKTLDDFFTEIPPPNFIKIDVEGFEQNVVRGGSSLLETYRPTVVMEMNHFCLDVLQRITVPDFLDFMRSVFPFLYAIDGDNETVVDLHIPEQAYFVMHEHVVRHRFPNIVGGWSKEINLRLKRLSSQNIETNSLFQHMQSNVSRIMYTIKRLMQST